MIAGACQEKLAELLGPSLTEVWNELRSAIEGRYEMERAWGPGGKRWALEYKYRRGGKTLCALYAAGLALETKAAWDFCRPGPHGFADNGLFRVSRNPMYVSYLLVLLGIATLAASPAMLALALGFQAAGHRLVLAEERWCRERFGDPYEEYMGRTRRYL